MTVPPTEMGKFTKGMPRRGAQLVWLRCINTEFQGAAALLGAMSREQVKVSQWSPAHRQLDAWMRGHPRVGRGEGENLAALRGGREKVSRCPRPVLGKMPRHSRNLYQIK